MVYARKLSAKPVWHIPLLCVQWKTPGDGQRNCPKHVEFYSKNKLEKLVHLIGFVIRIYHNARSPERQNPYEPAGQNFLTTYSVIKIWSTCFVFNTFVFFLKLQIFLIFEKPYLVAVINNKPLLIMRLTNEESWMPLWCGFPTYGLWTQGWKIPDMKQLDKNSSGCSPGVLLLLKADVSERCIGSMSGGGDQGPPLHSFSLHINTGHSPPVLIQTSSPVEDGTDTAFRNVGLQ